METCRRCCQVTPTGCMNAMDYNIRGRFISYMSFCQDCECDDPNSGCGWKANSYGRVECTSCDYLKSLAMHTAVIYFNLAWVCWMWL